MKAILTLTITCLIVFSCGKKKDTKDTASQKSNAPVVVDIIIATPQAINNTIEVNGTVVANESVELRSEISGRLTFLNIKEGTRIAKGSVIAKINDADLRAQLQKLKVQLGLAQTTEQRYGKLIAISGINQADYDAALNQVNSLKADVRMQQELINKTVLRAPFSGVVGLRQVSPGALVTPSDVLATLQQLSKLKIDFTVPEEYGNLITKGKYVTVLVDATGGKKMKALIVATEPTANASTRNTLVRATLEDGTANLGSFVKVYLDAGGAKSSVLVPSSAIIPEDKDKTLVLIKNGKAKFVKVETGFRQADNVEITSGIQQGDSVVVSGVLFTKPNAPVKVRSVKKLEQPIP